MIDEHRMKCSICPISCEEFGFCGGFFFNNNSWQRVYYNLKIVEATVEQIGFYHFCPGQRSILVISSGCNLPCIFCPEHDTVFEKKFAWSLDRAYSTILSEIHSRNPQIIGFYCNSILDSEVIARLKKFYWGKIVAKSNGFLSNKSINFLLDHVDGIIIRFLGFSVSSYCRLSVHPYGYKYAIKTLKAAITKNIHTEIEFHIVPGVTSEDEFMQFIDVLDTIKKDIPLHLKRFYPDFLEKSRAPTKTELLMRFYRLAKKKLRYVYTDLWYPHTNDTYCPNGHRVIRRLGWKVIEKNLIHNKCKICGAPIPIVLDETT
ncbi:MAG: hypothetical protein Q6363_008560 [Candidatus Njordarchaeota archaeon]